MSAGLLTYVAGAVFLLRFQPVLARPLSALPPGLLPRIVGGLVLALGVMGVGAAIAYGAGLLIEAPHWAFAAGQGFGFAVFPAALAVVLRDPNEGDPSPAAALAAVALGLSICVAAWAFAFRRGRERSRKMASRPEAEPAALSQIDFSAVKRAPEPAPDAPPGESPPKGP